MLLACSSQPTVPDAGSDPVTCTSSEECDSHRCVDPTRGLRVEDPHVPRGTEGRCCATTFSVSGRGLGECDNTCGTSGCYRRARSEYEATLQQCGEACSEDNDCLSEAFCDTRDSTCTPRDCVECWTEGGDCLFDQGTCASECKIPICNIPCGEDGTCEHGRCITAPSGRQACAPSQCEGCFADRQTCDLDPYSCGFEACVGCIPNCDGKECGSDGCVGLCGACAEGEQCVGSGCVSCPRFGQECNPGFETCYRYRYTCDGPGGEERCAPTSEVAVGAPCHLGDYAGTCHGAGGCHTSRPCEPGECDGVDAGSSGSGSGLCIDLVEQLPAPGETYLDFLCPPREGSAYFGLFQNNCAGSKYCAICGGPSSNARECQMVELEPGERFREYGIEGNVVHCTGHTVGWTIACVDGDDATGRSQLTRTYAGL